MNFSNFLNQKEFPDKNLTRWYRHPLNRLTFNNYVQNVRKIYFNFTHRSKMFVGGLDYATSLSNPCNSVIPDSCNLPQFT